MNWKLSFSIVMIVICVNNIKSQNLEKQSWTSFTSIFDSSNIELSLYLFEGGKIRGNYLNKKKKNRILINGKQNGNVIEFSELLIGNIKGKFIGKLDSSDTLTGILSDSLKKNVVQLKFKLNSIFWGIYEKEYKVIYGSASEVENFTQLVKESILKKNKTWISNNVCYPITVRINNKRTMVVKNRSQIIQNFNKIFTISFLNRIKFDRTFDLFYNEGGVMIGDGDIYISNTVNSNKNKHYFCISSIAN